MKSQPAPATLLSVLLALLLAAAASAQDVRFDEGDDDGAAAEPGAEDASDRVPLAEQAPETKPLAIVGADIHPVVGEPIPGGTILLRDGRIEAILDADGRGRGRRRSLEGYERIDARGLRAYPGLFAAGADGLGIDTDWYAGAAADALERSLADSYDAWADDLQWAASAGITSALVYNVPFGAQGPLVARGDVLKVSPGQPRGVLVEEAAAVWASDELFGAKGAHDFREALRQAREWSEKPKKERKDDPAKRLVLRVAEGEVPLLLPASSKEQVLAALDLAEEVGFRPVFYHCNEAWVLAERIEAAGGAAVQHVRMSWGKARDDRRGLLPGGWRFDAPAVLTRAGVPTAVLPLADTIMTWGVAGRDLTNYPMEAAFAQRGGLSAQQALEAITIVPARLYGVDDRLGSLEVGKDADVILVDGDVLDYRAFVRKSIVNGAVVYDAETNHFWSDVVADRVRGLGGS